MGQISRALAEPAQFEYLGQPYKLAPWTYGVIAEFEAYLQENALLTMRKMKRLLTDQEYNALVSQTRRDIDSGMYTFGTAEVNRALDSARHFKHLVLLCLQVHHPELTAEFVDGLMRDMGEEVMGKVEEANSDPNRRTPQAPTSAA